MRALVWFRADLRTDDNRALRTACAAARRGVIGVFCICPQQWHEHDWGAKKAEFVMRNLACLSEQLRKLNIPLLIRTEPWFDEVPKALLTLARKHQCDALHFNKEYEVNERHRDAQVMQVFADDGRAVHQYDDQVIVPPDAVQTRGGGFYTVFTPFKRTWLEHVRSRDDVAPVGPPKAQPELACAPDAVPEDVAGFDLLEGDPGLWLAGEKLALELLGRFITKRVRQYDKQRDLPACEGTSRLSPYLTSGVLSVRRCLAEAQEAEHCAPTAARAGAEAWINELAWREFYRHVLVGYPRVSMGQPFREETTRLKWRDDEAEFAAWCAGRTGIPIVDAGMRQLAQTGWMHNRVRMITAMYLTKDLLIDWRRGEQHFMRHLVDGDLASNNGGWQWSASTGTDAAPYFRIFNPYSQSKKCDPDGEYIHQYVAELRDVEPAVLHDPHKLDLERRRALHYPEPICNHADARQRTLAAFEQLRS